MAAVIDTGIRATDDTGAVYVGATLTVYTAGTTTPANIYRDAALTQAMTNPTSGADKSNSHGYFPQVFAAEGATFDAICKDANGVTLWSRVSVPSVGSDTGDITRDFGAGGRLTITGAAGVIQVHAGPPSGDDTGGSLKLTGDGATQADLITLDAASVDTTGTLTENGKKLRGVVATAAGASSGSASVIIALPNTPANCRNYEVDLIDINGGGTGNITLTVSTDNGVSYLAAGYYSTETSVTRSTGVTSGSNSAVNALLASMNAMVAGGANLRVTTPIAAGRALINGYFWADSAASAGNEAGYAGFNALTPTLTGRVTHIKLTFPATVACTYRVVPQRGFGE